MVTTSDEYFVKNYCCFVRYHDLKHDIHVWLKFENPNDLIEFFHEFNPCSIDIEYMEVYYREEFCDD